MNINSNVPFVLSVKLLKTAKYFHCGTEIWDKIINSKYYVKKLAYSLWSEYQKTSQNKVIFELWDQICPNLEFLVKFWIPNNS